MASTSTSGRGQQERHPLLALDPPEEKIKSPVAAKQYDVFINHRGPDVKTTLAQQLYDSLHQAGIRAYLDVSETELGDYFTSAIRNAISSATVHIAILSPRYAESAWCLAELALMFKTKARIIPLFYHVPPSDFRHIINGVAEAFREHEEKDRYPRHDIQQWKECLQKVSGIKGYEFNGQNDDLSKLCHDVVSVVVSEKQKRKIPLRVAKYEVGLNELVKDFHSSCQRNGKIRDKIIGIYGMGGSGKTTLAKYLFNRKSSEFSESTFLFDVRGKYVKDDLNSVQSQLLNDLFPSIEHEVRSVEDGIAVIKYNLERSSELRFLIVIDNVDDQQQLDALLPIDALNPNTLVIVTTRDERLLKQAAVRVRYKIEEMNPEHSRQLFCWHAFHRQSCIRGFENLVDNFVDLCGGLPLALQVMGAHVHGSNKDYWKLQLDHFKARLHKGIKDTLKISFDALEEDEKQIFMDISCFFIEEPVNSAISIWKASGWRAEHALQTLKDKCLVESTPRLGGIRCGEIMDNYEPPSYFGMHDHLRDLGREMADTEMNNPRRLWRHEDIIGIREIKGFQDILKGSDGKCFRCYSDFEDSESNLRMSFFLESSTTSTNLRWLDIGSEIPEWIPLQNLHTLNLDGDSPWRLWKSDNQVSLKLKELRCYIWPGFRETTQEKYMRDVNELVSSLGILKKLETLQLNFDSGTLEWNIEWTCLLKSVRELTNLQVLELLSCDLEGEFALGTSGETTGDQFCMGSLEAITLCGALKTRRVSISGQFCPTLKSLKLYSMENVIEVDLRRVTTLECLVLLRCKKLREVLGNGLPQLEIFRMKSCPTMTQLPNFGHASCLKRVYISRCRKLQDISPIQCLKGLKRIWIAYCPELKNIKAIEQLKGLKRIWINKCRELQGAICLKELKALKSVFIGHCRRLQSIQGIEYLKRLESIVINACPQLQQVPDIEKLKGLKEMIIADTPIIRCVERLQPQWFQELPLEITIIMGRSAMSDKIAEENDFKLTSFMSNLFADKFGILDGFCEIDCSRDYLYGWEGVEEQIKEKIQSLQITQHSFSTFIFCAMVDAYLGIATGFCDGSSILDAIHFFGSPKRDHYRGFLGGRRRKMYACVVNEERLSNYDSWMPSSHMWSGCSVMEAFFMGVKAGEERKTLHMLQRLFAQPRVGNSEYHEYHEENIKWPGRIVHREKETLYGAIVDDEYDEEGAIWHEREVDWFDHDDESDGDDDNAS